MTNDDLQNIAVTLAARALAPDLRLVLRAGSNATAGETRSLEPLGHVRDVHRIGAVYLAGLALGSAATHVVVDGETAHLRDDRGALERCPYPSGPERRLGVLPREVVNAADGWPVAEAAVGSPAVVVADE